MSEGQAGVPPQLAVYRDTIDNLDAALLLAHAVRLRSPILLVERSVPEPDW